LKETSLDSNKFHRRSAFSSLSDFKKLHIIIKSKRPIPDEFNESEGIFSPSTKFPNKQNKDKVKISLRRQSSNFEIVNVLVVDDCSVNRMVHKMLLEKYSNFKITEHCNGAEAVDYIKILSQNNPKKVLILMDINMPVMDGIEATKAIRLLNVDFPISIIAVSAFSNEEDIQKITDCGMDSYITKPVTKESLSRILSLAC
jgi:CheY-like chemotaxis protein